MLVNVRCSTHHQVYYLASIFFSSENGYWCIERAHKVLNRQWSWEKNEITKKRFSLETIRRALKLSALYMRGFQASNESAHLENGLFTQIQLKRHLIYTPIPLLKMLNCYVVVVQVDWALNLYSNFQLLWYNCGLRFEK